MNVATTIRSLREAKLTPGIALLILTAAVALAYVGLGVSVLRARAESSALASQITSGTEAAAMAGALQDDLDRLPGDLQDARERLADAEAAFPTQLDPNDVLATILDHADASGLRVVSVQLGPADAGQGEGSSAYSALEISLRAEGSLDRFVRLLRQIEDGSGATAIVSYAVGDTEGERALVLQLRSFARTGPAPTPTPPPGIAEEGP